MAFAGAFKVEVPAIEGTREERTTAGLMPLGLLISCFNCSSATDVARVTAAVLPKLLKISCTLFILDASLSAGQKLLFQRIKTND